MILARAELQPAEDILVIGAGSGVGSAAIQIAKFFARGCLQPRAPTKNCKKQKQLGADHLINHKTQKIRDEVRRVTNKRGVDVVSNTSHGHLGRQPCQSRPRRRLVTCGATTGYDAKVDLRYLFTRQLSLLGSYMGTKSELHSVMRLVASGHFKPIVDRIFPLAEAAAAHSYLESSLQFGKVVLSV